MKQMIGMFLDDCPDASYEDILTACGSPTDVAADLLADVPERERNQYRIKRKRLYTAAIIIFLTVSICACSSVAYFIRNPWTAEITTVIDYTDKLPSYWDYAEKYGINYEYDTSGRIIQATDNDGNKIEVDKDGIPTDKEKYSLEEEEK